MNEISRNSVCTHCTSLCFLCGLFLKSVVFGLPPAEDTLNQRISDPEVLAESILQGLRAQDTRISTGYTVIFKLSSNGRRIGPNFGRWTKNCKFTVQRDVKALTVEMQYEDFPQYEPISAGRTESIDYDRDGNLIHWRPLRKVMLNSPDMNLMRDDQELFLIRPDNTIVDSLTHSKLIKYPIGSSDSIYEINQLFLVSGYSYSERLDGEVRIGAAEPGLIEVIAGGKYAQNVFGEWTIAVAKVADTLLIRKASFTATGSNEPVLEVVSEGVLRSGNVSLSRSGTIRYTLGSSPDYMLSVFIVSFAPEPDLEHIRVVREAIEAARSDGLKVIDLSSR